MKVVAINGSPRIDGNTAQAIEIVAVELKKQNIDVETLQVGNKNIRGCMACMKCVELGRCVMDNDVVNEYIAKMKEADGLLLASPVYYSGVAGTMKAFLDRAFLVTGVTGNAFRYKVGAAITVVRRTGGMPTVDNLDRYIQYSEMFVPTANYWNVIHGANKGEIKEDLEGVQIGRILGKNMAWLMKAVELGKKEMGIPEKEKKDWMNFVR
ncbi:flavodoxin family protein [Clostridiaceae bacterium M8S5]|nr:flavodoxin family protein [Clostridiaceae bacterium M8S5]